MPIRYQTGDRLAGRAALAVEIAITIMIDVMMRLAIHGMPTAWRRDRLFFFLAHGARSAFQRRRLSQDTRGHGGILSAAIPSP